MAEVAGAIDGPQNFSLWLPSPKTETQIPFNARLAELQWELRYSQAHDVLNSLRKNLQMHAHLFKFKNQFVRGQSANTRARNAIATVQARVDASGDEYRAAHTALSSLGVLLGKLGWQTRFLPLTDADKRELTEAEPGMSEGKRKLSWIWKTTDVTGSAADMEKMRSYEIRYTWSGASQECGNVVSGGSQVVDGGDVASSAIFDVAGTVVENKIVKGLAERESRSAGKGGYRRRQKKNNMTYMY
jgi:hypothetical protein